MKNDLPDQSFENIAEKGYHFSPFGPHFLYLKLHDKLRLDLLDVVKDIKNDQEEKRRGDALKDPEWNKGLKSTIHDGESYGISYEVNVKHKNIMVDVLSYVTSLYAEIDPKTVQVFEAWYVTMKEGDFHILHSHNDLVESGGIYHQQEGHKPKRLFSGAIYLEVPEDLEFPQGNVNWIAGNADQTFYNSHHYHVPEPGDCLMWPAWLKHYVCPFRSKEERTMISFNTGMVSKDE
jgi:uncharacterized protein (TIGR02466 family)